MIIGKKRKGGRRVAVRRVFRFRRRKETDPAFVLNINTGYQGVKKLKELAEVKKVTISRKTYKKLKSKLGHLSVREIKNVLENPDGIYYDNNREAWLYTQNKGKTKKVVIKIEKGSRSHRIATAYVMSSTKFSKETNKLNLDLIWQR